MSRRSLGQVHLVLLSKSSRSSARELARLRGWTDATGGEVVPHLVRNYTGTVWRFRCGENTQRRSVA